MVASLLRLRLHSLGNLVLRPRSAAEGLGVAIGALFVVAAIIGILAFAGVAGRTTPELRGAAFVVLGSAVVAGFWLLPFAFRVDDGMRPRAFAHFEVSPGRLATALALSRLISVPVVLLIVLLVIQVAAWRSAGSATLVVAIVAGLVLLAMCVLGSQVASAVAGRGIVWRNVAVLLALTAAAIGAPLAAALVALDWSSDGVTYLRRATEVLVWTPVGVAWGAPGAAASGDLGLAWGRIAVSLGIVAVLAALWYWIVRRAGGTVPRAQAVKRLAGFGVFDAVPSIPGGAIAARSIVYWMRDSRYAVPLLILPIIPIAIAVSFAIAGIPVIVVAWLGVPLVALIIGWSVHNDIAADGTAFWLHVVTGVGGRADRWGRVVAPLIIGAVVVVGGSFLTGWLIGSSALVLPLTALSSCLLLVGLGVGSAASAIAPYPTVAPGDGPFAQPQALRGGEPAKQAASLLIALCLALPAIASMIVVATVDPAFLVPALWIAFGSGILVLVAGTELGGLVVSRRAPEILAFTQQN